MITSKLPDTFWTGDASRVAVMWCGAVVGCGELLAPPGAHVRRDDAGVRTVVCAASRETFRLVCVGRRWTGKLHNCTRTGDESLMQRKLQAPCCMAAAQSRHGGRKQTISLNLLFLCSWSAMFHNHYVLWNIIQYWFYYFILCVYIFPFCVCVWLFSPLGILAWMAI